MSKLSIVITVTLSQSQRFHFVTLRTIEVAIASRGGEKQAGQPVYPPPRRQSRPHRYVDTYRFSDVFEARETCNLHD